jgi:hypothetical protein
VLAPETPTGGAIRQTVLDNQPDGGVNDASGVVAARMGEIGHIGVEVFATAGAVVLGVEHDHVSWPPSERVAQVMESAVGGAIAIRTVPTPRAWSPPVIATADAEIGRGQVLDADHALSGVGSVFARPWHGESPGREGLPGITHCNGVLFTNTAR